MSSIRSSDKTIELIKLELQLFKICITLRVSRIILYYYYNLCKIVYPSIAEKRYKIIIYYNNARRSSRVYSVQITNIAHSNNNNNNINDANEIKTFDS